MVEPTPSSSPCTGARAYGEGTPASLFPHGHGRLERHFPRLPRWMVTNSRGRGLCKPCTVYHWLLLAALWRGLKAAWPQLWQEKHKWYWIALLLENVFANYHLPPICECGRCVKSETEGQFNHLPTSLYSVKLLCVCVWMNTWRFTCRRWTNINRARVYSEWLCVNLSAIYGCHRSAAMTICACGCYAGGCSVNREACLWQSYLHSSVLLGVRPAGIKARQGGRRPVAGTKEFQGPGWKWILICVSTLVCHPLFPLRFCPPSPGPCSATSFPPGTLWCCCGSLNLSWKPVAWVINNT